MFIKQKLPLQLFCILEKVKPVVWTSETNLPNHYYIFVPSNWIVPITTILKKETSFSQTFLADVTAIDSSHYNTTNQEVISFFKKNRKFPLYNYYCLTTKTRLTFILELTSNFEVESIDSIFRGAG
jgi:NADH:ubiquinone oxidoreductase subunit C